jgi:uncharacterized protein YegP (UPF0339 family)
MHTENDPQNVGAVVADTAPETGQTVQTRTPWYEVAKDDSGNWHWMLWSGNGRMMATNMIGYPTRKACLQAIRALRDVAQQANVICEAR